MVMKKRTATKRKTAMIEKMISINDEIQDILLIYAMMHCVGLSMTKWNKIV